MEEEIEPEKEKLKEKIKEEDKAVAKAWWDKSAVVFKSETPELQELRKKIENREEGIWIARNNNGSIHGFDIRPRKHPRGYWYGLTCIEDQTLDWKNWHPEFTCDSKPIRVNIKSLGELWSL